MGKKEGIALAKAQAMAAKWGAVTAVAAVAGAVVSVIGTPFFKKPWGDNPDQKPYWDIENTKLVTKSDLMPWAGHTIEPDALWSFSKPGFISPDELMPWKDKMEEAARDGAKWDFGSSSIIVPTPRPGTDGIHYDKKHDRFYPIVNLKVYAGGSATKWVDGHDLGIENLALVREGPIVSGVTFDLRDRRSGKNEIGIRLLTGDEYDLETSTVFREDYPGLFISCTVVATREKATFALYSKQE